MQSPGPLPYYGGKARIAARIVSLMPAHRVYVEAFAGGLSVLLTKPPAEVELVNDLDGEVVRFWRVLRDHPDEFARLCALTPYSRAEFESAVDRSDCTDLEAARRWWVRVRQGLGHGARETIGWFRTNGESRAGRVLRSLDQFSRVAARLARVDLECRPAVEVITLWDAPDVLHYCDPPYLSSTRRSPGDRYAVEMTTADHERLAETLHAVQGAVLLSGYPDPLYEVLCAGWHRTEIPNRLLAGQVASGENSRPVTEVIWQNRPPPQRGLYDALPSPP